jgi:rhodanese-related sulfurtransferase
MMLKQRVAIVTSLILISVALVGALSVSAYAQRANQSKSSPPTPITPEELKLKLERNEPLTIIDVRSNSTYAESDNKIKGSIHVKLRKLQYRLGFSPFKDLPRDREVVTYCACPSDESSARAAEILVEAGFKRVRVLKGGWQAWLQARGQVESRPRGL